MVSKVFLECLSDVYHDEQTGEAAFEAMLAIAEDDQQRYILASLMQLETEGKAIIRPTLMKYGISLMETPEVRTTASAAAGEINQLPWTERFGALADMVKNVYLPRYEELASLVTAEEDPEAFRIAQFMGDHERALVAASEKVATGQSDPMEPVVALLHFPLSPVS